MAKDILITPGQAKIGFSGATAGTISLNVMDDGSISFDGSNGQLFSVSDDLSGTIFSVNDISGIPSLEVIDDGTVKIAEYSGNVLIGTNIDNSTDKLQVSGKIAATSFVKSGGTSSQFLKADGSSDSTVYTTNTGTVTSITAGTGLSGGTITTSGSISLPNVGTSGTYSGGISSITTDSQGRITSVSGSAGYLTSSTITLTNDTATSATYYPTFATATSGSTTGVRVSSSKLTFNPSTGMLSATALTSLSDEKFKMNIEKSEGLSVISRLRGVEFDWKENSIHSAGVIAQEVEKILPHCISTNLETDVKTVNYSSLIGYLINAINEQQEEIKNLKDIINESKISIL